MPDTIYSSEVFDPSRLSADKKRQFIDALYRLHSRIFDGVEKDEFVSYVVDSPADWTRIRVYKNSRHQWIGYCAVHRFNMRVSNRPIVIIRAEAGILRQYRGRSLTLWFGFTEAIKYRIKNPFCALYYLGSFVHPSVLYMFSRYFHECYPRPDMPVPAGPKGLMLALADIFHLEPVERQDALVRKVGWITKESEEDREFWQNHANPTVKYYIKTNPGYIDGNGLLTLVPLTFTNIFVSLGRFVRNKVKRRFTK